jgi:hypothetical protein
MNQMPFFSLSHGHDHMNKFKRDQEVAVLYSPGYGAGWSTWAEQSERELLLFDPDIVQLVMERDQNQITLEEFEQRMEMIWQLKGYTSYCAPGEVQVTWLPEGTQFRIHEYDGSERVITLTEDIWHVA